MISRLLMPSAVLRAVGSGIVVLMLLSTSGCIRAAALIGKMAIGDPKADSKFESSTGVDLQEEKNAIIIHCSAPLSVADAAETLTHDVEGDLIRRMRQKEIPIVDQNRVVEILDARGGRYDTQVLIDEIPDARYLFEIVIERYQLREPKTPSMYHGRCVGTIIGYEIEGGSDEDTGDEPRRLVRIFEQEFDVDYPNGHPIPAEQMSESTFRKKFVSQLTLRLGNMFYDVTTRELL